MKSIFSEAAQRHIDNCDYCKGLELRPPALVQSADQHKETAVDNILNEIKVEREHQDKKWGDTFDSKNTANDWVAYIAKHAGMAVTLPWNATTFRTQLVKVATICVAAIQWIDRTKGDIAKRHYD